MTTNEPELPLPFNGYPNYDDVINPVLRAWNRLNVIFNMKELLSNNAMAVSYTKQFSHKDQLEIVLMSSRIIQNGYENTRREIMRANNV